MGILGRREHGGGQRWKRRVWFCACSSVDGGCGMVEDGAFGRRLAVSDVRGSRTTVPCVSTGSRGASRLPGATRRRRRRRRRRSLLPRRGHGRTVPKRVLGWVSSTKPDPFWPWAVEGGGEFRWPLVERRRENGTWSMCQFDGKDDVGAGGDGRRRRRGEGPGT